MFLLAHFGMLCDQCAFDEAVLHKICRHLPKLHVCKKIKFVGVVAFRRRGLKQKLMAIMRTRGPDIRTVEEILLS
jgi:hypothetical protein